MMSYKRKVLKLFKILMKKTPTTPTTPNPQSHNEKLHNAPTP